MPDKDPTYSFAEVMAMLRELHNDISGLHMVWNLVVEDKYLYCLRDLQTIKFYYQMLVATSA